MPPPTRDTRSQDGGIPAINCPSREILHTYLLRTWEKPPPFDFWLLQFHPHGRSWHRPLLDLAHAARSADTAACGYYIGVTSGLFPCWVAFGSSLTILHCRPQTRPTQGSKPRCGPTRPNIQGWIADVPCPNLMPPAASLATCHRSSACVKQY